MTTLLFRLSEDESSLVQLYRTLPDDMKAAILGLAMLQSEDALCLHNNEGNVVAFAAQMNR